MIDNPKRDLRGISLLAYALAREGRSSVIVPMYAQGYDLPLLSCESVVLNYVRQSNEDLVRTYRDLGMHIAVLDTEGGILSRAGLREPHNWARSLRETGLIDLVNDYFFWGDAVRAAFAQESGLQQDRMHLTGCPRYDLCSPPWNAALTYERKGYVLVNTNFSAINPGFTRSSDAEKHIFRSLGWDPEYVDTWFADMEALFPRYQDAVAELARALPNQTVLVRPHPFENETVYRQRFADIPNIVVDGRGDALNMIANAACIVHLNCGTAVDALLQRKPAISLEYLNTELLLDHTPLPSRLSIRASSFEALVGHVSDHLAAPGDFVPDGARDEIEPWFYKVDGKAAERVATILGRLPKQPVKRNFGAAMRGGRPNANPAQIAQGAANVVAGSRFVTWSRNRLDRSRRNKTITVEQVQSLLDTFAECCNGARFRAAHARNPLTGLPMSSIEVKPA
ncbi:surface carbohydrate biosynthesis protein [Devosia sp. XGJD_8]|uniref:surface carbohydrate biosynthesis protein n=1 Tax=Devosia sp. XGJD_8 TaxID=3391187 RepID=UPI003985228F